METKELFGSEHAASDTSAVEDVEELYGEAVTPIQWLMRTYQTGQEWYRKAREVLFSMNGDSAAARNRVAGMLRSYFVFTKLEAEDIERWKKGENTKETIRIIPPKLKDSNATYIDWVYIADFLLLPCISITDELEAENTKRNVEFDNAMRSYRKRLAVEAVRKILREGLFTGSDKELAESLESEHPDISGAVVKVARKMERNMVEEPTPKEPQRAAPMPLYKALYFPSVTQK